MVHNPIWGTKIGRLVTWSLLEFPLKQLCFSGIHDLDHVLLIVVIRTSRVQFTAQVLCAGEAPQDVGSLELVTCATFMVIPMKVANGLQMGYPPIGHWSQWPFSHAKAKLLEYEVKACKHTLLPSSCEPQCVADDWRPNCLRISKKTHGSPQEICREKRVSLLDAIFKMPMATATQIRSGTGTAEPVCLLQGLRAHEV